MARVRQAPETTPQATIDTGHPRAIEDAPFSYPLAGEVCWPANLPSLTRGGQISPIHYRQHSLERRLPFTQARREHKTMATTATNTTSLITATLPGSPYSVCMARYYVRAALRDYDLGGFSAAAAAVTSELVTNAITHTDTTKVGLELTCLEGTAAVAIVVTDDSSRFPVLRTATADSENGHGLQIVAALSARWGWRRQHPGKAVYAILAKEV